MAAPTPTARATPIGIVLKDGYRSTLTCALDPNIEFREKAVKPPGYDGGAPIDTTTMFSTTYRQKAPRALSEMTNASIRAAYDPVVYQTILSILKLETTWTTTFPDGTTLAFYGFLNRFDPEALQEGQQPEAMIEIVPTNSDPTTGAPEAAVLTNVPGT